MRLSDGSSDVCSSDLAHEKGRARASRDERFEEMSLLLLAPHLREQIHIALVGRHRVDRDRTQRREARFLEDGRRIALAEMASVGANMRREHPRLARLDRKSTRLNSSH